MRLAHITDLHLLSFEGAQLRDFVNKRWAGGLNLLVNRGRHHLAEVFDALVDDLNRLGVDHVACTGDVSNLALEGEFRFARTRFERLALKPVDVTCVPGNHDTYIAETAGLFERLFGDYCTRDEGWDFARPWPLVRVRGDLAVVGLSTSQASGLLMGHGTIGDEQRERLAQTLADPRLEGKFRVVMLHHPATGRHARSWRRGLRDHAELASILSRVGAELVLHGHEHLDLRGYLLGPGGKPIPVLGVQSGTYALDSARRRARYRVFTFTPRDGARPRLEQVELRTWRPDAKAFAPEATEAW